MDQQGLTIEGPPGTAEIRWGYHVAARLGAWGVHNDTLSAGVVDADLLRLAQPGLTFAVVRPNGLPWTWPIVQLTLIGDQQLTATLGPKERVH